ncbi:MAG: phytanoyl-CoA dioxygenase family protein [Gammaproteobacteria bacterium]|nr:phytanoyl-CoA dioxygenase family protein [Gammaproteobacteria bacterium]
MATPSAGLVSDEDRQLYADEGYMVLKGVVPEDMLRMLREECSYFLGYMDARIDAGLVASEALTFRGKRYFVNNRYRFSERLWRYVYGDLMADVCGATLGDDAYLFNEQWVVKGAEQGMRFSWHQDSGYVKFMDPETVHEPYLTCWCALDDVDETNGTVYLLPHSRAGTKGRIITHTRDAVSHDLVGYTGDDPGVALDVPAGSIVAFSSYNLHRSGANTTRDMRRVYLTQYVSAPVFHSQTGERFNLAVEFLKGGRNVYDHAMDTPERWGGTAPPALVA